MIDFQNSGLLRFYFHISFLFLFPLLHQPSLISTLNAAAPEHLVYKDSFLFGHGGSTIDRKRVLDLSPQRLETLEQLYPDFSVAPAYQQYLATPIQFFQTMVDQFCTKISNAVSLASGCPLDERINVAYRMVDYYSVDPTASPSPRCGQHQDFGYFTLIFADVPGLEVYVYDDIINEWQWKILPFCASTSAYLVCGLCTQIRSNNRIKAILHRVSNSGLPSSSATDIGVTTAPRTCAILFVAPSAESVLQSTVLPPVESNQYPHSISAGELKELIGKKWRRREGTIITESESNTSYPTQQDIIQQTMQCASA